MSFIPEDIIARVLERTDIAELIGTYVPLKRTGKNLKACCPFHNEKTPSFVVTPDKQIFHCFGCSVGGNAISFVMKQERLEFPEAVRFLADKLGIEVPDATGDDAQRDGTRDRIFEANTVAVEYFHHNLVNGREGEVGIAREYIKNRKLNLDAVKRFKVGYAYDAWDGLIKHLRSKGFDNTIIEKSGLVVARDDKKGFYDRFRGRVVFPIFDYRGRSIAFGARALKKDDKVKYINSPETPVYTKGRNLYGFNWAKEAIGREDRVIIVEGYLDFIRPYLAGVENVSASQGTALTPDQIRLIRRYTRNVTMLFDMDAAGQSAALRSLDILLEEEMDVKVAALADGEDPDSFIQKYGADDFRKRIGEAKSLFDYKLERLTTEFGAKKVEGRGIICREMLMTIEKVKSEIVKNGYLRELAARLNVTEDVVLRERQNILKKQPAVSVRTLKEAPKPAKSVALSSDEEWLLKFVMTDAAWLQAARTQIAPEDLSGEAAQEMLRIAYRLLDEGREAGPAGLAGALQDEGLRQKLMELASTPSVTDAKSAPRAFADCVKRIRDRGRKVRRQDVREMIRRAEKAGDHEALRRAQEEFNQLLKG
ncbi:MAG: DNA primase [Candidatus Omnitrophica bacterium]|nr:DNA primase [Candidatus Omnitrophota bacterium]